MPRDGSNVYHRPVGIDAIANRTIESAKYNLNVSDVEQDLNTPRPIVAGGTGATSAAGARTNLHAEAAGQQVDNFASFTFENGSFWSTNASGADGPSGTAGHGLYGAAILYGADTNFQQLVAYCPDLDQTWRRRRTGSGWQAWTQMSDSSIAAMDTAYVNVAGDTMTGTLTTPGTVIDAGASSSQLVFNASGAPKWALVNYQAIDGRFSIDQPGVGGWLTIAKDTGIAHLASTITSSSPTTGALTVAGGLGIAGVINAAGNIVTAGGSFLANSATPALALTSTTTNNSIQAMAYNTGNNYFDTIGTGVTQVRTGTSSISSNVFQIAHNNGNVAFQSTVNSTSSTTGALTVAGGAGIAGNLNSGNHGIQAASGNPYMAFLIGGVTQSSVSDTGSAIAVYSNVGLTAGMSITHGASAWTAISDARLPYKRTARQVSALEGLPHVFLYEAKVNGKYELFAKAQEIAKGYPHIVKRGSGPDDYVPTGMSDEKAWGVSYDRMGIIALQACKELLEQIVQLKTRIEQLEGKREAF